MALPDYLPADVPEWRKYAEEFRLTDPGLAVQFDRLQDPIAKLNATSMDVLGQTIKEGLDRGYSAMQIANGVSDEGYLGIGDKFRGFEDWRSEMIARTEAREAFSAGNLRAYATAQVEQVEAIDGDYDERCRVRNGERFPFDPVTGEIQAAASELEEHPNGGLVWGPVGSEKIDLLKPIVGETAAATEAEFAAEIPSWAADSIAAARAAFDEMGGLIPWKTEEGYLASDAADWIGRTRLPTKYAYEQLDHIKSVGADIEAEIERRSGGYFKKLDKAQGDLEKAQRREAEIEARREVLYKGTEGFSNSQFSALEAKIGDELDRLRAEMSQVFNQISEAQYQMETLTMNHPEQIIRDVLGELRPMGNVELDLREIEEGRLMTTSHDGLDEAAKFYPKDWLESSNALKAKPLQIATRIPADMKDRGFYNPVDGNIHMPRRSDPTLPVHELGHRMEDVNPNVSKSEWLFWNSRTVGEETKRLSELYPNADYGDSEFARKDKFVNAYMGKDYGALPDSGYELLTMGMESMKTGKYVLDAEYRQWLLGTLGLL